jgi:deazaflavin-dependent oxidoreductase (nitroreductase family)
MRFIEFSKEHRGTSEGGAMHDDIRQALDIGPAATLAERTIDITTVGRRSGQDRRIEICFYRVGDAIYLTGVPGPKRRDWLVNLEANPTFTFHLKNHVQADLPATATVITDVDQRRDVLRPVVDEYNARWSPDSPWPHGDLDEWVTSSPLARVTFADD